MLVISKQEMYNCDHYTINEIGIPGAKLMENAGRNSSLFIDKEILKTGSEVIVFCGHGNNGGDGFVIARYLKNWGHNPRIIITGKPNKMSPETTNNYQQCLDLDIQISVIGSIEEWRQGNINLNYYDLIVDAIFGVGFQGHLRGWIADLIKEINASETLTIAIDIASGLNADNGMSDLCVKADYTVTMAAYKYGHILGKGREFSGETLVIDIGIPSEVFDHFNLRSRLVAEEDIVYPERSLYSHKGDYGRIAVIAGSPGYSGAAIMACRSALRAGAGLITLFHPKGMECIFETSLIEVMTKQIPEDIEEFLKLVCIYDAVLIGPGIGVNKSNLNILKRLMQRYDKPIVIDADAINLISENPELKSLLKGKLITPHLGEFSRLTGKFIAEVKENRINLLKDFVETYQCSVLLKSATTIYCDSNNLLFDTSGNDGLSTGGSGDVLAGIIVSFLGQKLDYKDASVAASYLIGSTAEKLALIRQPASIIPTDIIEEIFRR